MPGVHIVEYVCACVDV